VHLRPDLENFTPLAGDSPVLGIGQVLTESIMPKDNSLTIWIARIIFLLALSAMFLYHLTL
jgi:hypothetical protein